MTAATDPIASSYDDAFRRAHAAKGEIYGALTGFSAAAHVRRMELLAELDLGDLGDAVAVDYGVGPWGFAAVFPVLRECRHGIGIDISGVALEISRDVERDRGAGDRFEFRQSRGDVLPLEDASVDVLFAGESIEHVDMPRCSSTRSHACCARTANSSSPPRTRGRRPTSRRATSTASVRSTSRS
jgi:SAM-dependent methyltransferase